LNGCVYPDELMLSEPAFADAESFAQERTALMQTMRRTLASWIGQHDAMRASDFLARETLAALGPNLASRFLLTSVGRITHQKVGLLLHKSAGSNNTLLDRLLQALSEKGCFVMLGAGDEHLERQLVEHSARHQNYTVENDVDGFCFEGADLDEKAENCATALDAALELRDNPRGYREMRTQAREKRVSWRQAAKQYIEKLYVSEPSRRAITSPLMSRASR